MRLVRHEQVVEISRYESPDSELGKYGSDFDGYRHRSGKIAAKVIRAGAILSSYVIRGLGRVPGRLTMGMVGLVSVCTHVDGMYVWFAMAKKDVQNGSDALKRHGRENDQQHRLSQPRQHGLYTLPAVYTPYRGTESSATNKAWSFLGAMILQQRVDFL